MKRRQYETNMIQKLSALPPQSLLVLSDFFKNIAKNNFEKNFYKKRILEEQKEMMNFILMLILDKKFTPDTAINHVVPLTIIPKNNLKLLLSLELEKIKKRREKILCSKINKLLQEGIPITRISKDYQVSRSKIYRIKKTNS